MAEQKQPDDKLYITRAQQLFACDEIKIDDDPELADPEDDSGGKWVAAWVWVSNEDLELEVPDE